MALGLLTVFYAAIIAVTVICMLLLYRIKDRKKNLVLFYFMGIWTILLSVVQVVSLPVNDTSGQFVAAGIGILSFAGMMVQLVGKKGSSTESVAKAIVIIAMIFVTLNFFII